MRQSNATFLHYIHYVGTKYQKLSTIAIQVLATDLDYLVLNRGIAPCLSRHELLPFDRVTVNREGNRRRLTSPQAFRQQAASGSVCIHNVKSPTIDVNRATDGNVVHGVATGSTLEMSFGGANQDDDDV